jgi:hypothetical protein
MVLSEKAFLFLNLSFGEDLVPSRINQKFQCLLDFPVFLRLHGIGLRIG